jgi:hypothetical protein
MEMQLKSQFEAYWLLKRSHLDLRKTFLESLAESLANAGLNKKETIVKQLQEREIQRSMARKIRFLRGKHKSGSTTIITQELSDGTISNLTSKFDMEQAIMLSNLNKFKQSHQNDFYKPPLSRDLGFKATTSSSSAVLVGVYESNQPIPINATSLLDHLQMPDAVRELGLIYGNLTGSLRTLLGKSKGEYGMLS